MEVKQPLNLTKAADEKFCSECAAVIKARAVICPACGCPQGVTAVSGHEPLRDAQAKDKNTAGLLALLLGGLGVHKFYLDEPKSGALYLMFFWTFIPAILGLVEGVKLFGMSGRQFDALYNRS